ncbi:MAG: hypothetical protein U0Q08_11685 [Dermatophilaceae bacterium]
MLELADVIAVNKADGDGAGLARVAARELAGAMRLMMPGDVRRPPVLTCSAHTGDGLDEVWEAVLAHRAWLEEHHFARDPSGAAAGGLMWAMVDAHLHDAVRHSPSVRELRDALAADVREGAVSAVDGTARILDAFSGDLRRAGPAGSGEAPGGSPGR